MGGGEHETGDGKTFSSGTDELLSSTDRRNSYMYMCTEFLPLNYMLLCRSTKKNICLEYISLSK